MGLQGNLDKMVAQAEAPVQYSLPLGEQLLPLNRLLGKSVGLRHNGTINCTACGRVTKKSYSHRRNPGRPASASSSPRWTALPPWTWNSATSSPV